MRAVLEAVERARKGEGATVIEAKMYRLTPHSSDDDDRSYRSREEVEEHKKQDPILLAKEQLIAEGLLTEGEYEQLEEKAKAEVDEAVRIAHRSALPQGGGCSLPGLCHTGGAAWLRSP